MNNIMWSVLLTMFVYIVMSKIQTKTKLAILNPLLFSSVIIIAFLLISKIDYQKYSEGTEFLSFLIGPATVSLAIPLYQNLRLLKEHLKRILLTIFSGVLVHAVTIGFFSFIFKFDDTLVATFIPKSLTTAVAIGVSESLNGLSHLTISIVIITGVIGMTISDLVFKIFKIEDPISKGLSLGISSHALGTSKATSYGNIEASLATLALILTSIITVLLAPIIYWAITAII